MIHTANQSVHVSVGGACGLEESHLDALVDLVFGVPRVGVVPFLEVGDQPKAQIHLKMHQAASVVRMHQIQMRVVRKPLRMMKRQKKICANYTTMANWMITLFP